MSDYPLGGEDGFVELSDSSPAAPGGSVNITWQRHPGLSSGPGDLPSLSGSVPAAGAQQILAPQTCLHSLIPLGVGSIGDDNTQCGYFLTTTGFSVSTFGCNNPNPCSIQALVQGGSGGFASVGETGFTALYFGGFLAFQSAVLLEQTTDSRIWIGVSSLNGSNLQTDTPGTSGGSCAAFRYSTAAGDTNFQCVCADAASQTIVDSGVAADLLMHQFKIVQGSGEFLFYIDGALVATISTTLPSAGAAASDLVQYDAPGSSSGSPGFRVSYIFWWNTF